MRQTWDNFNKLEYQFHNEKHLSGSIPNGIKTNILAINGKEIFIIGKKIIIFFKVCQTWDNSKKVEYQLFNKHLSGSIPNGIKTNIQAIHGQEIFIIGKNRK